MSSSPSACREEKKEWRDTIFSLSSSSHLHPRVLGKGATWLVDKSGGKCRLRQPESETSAAFDNGHYCRHSHSLQYLVGEGRGQTARMDAGLRGQRSNGCWSWMWHSSSNKPVINVCTSSPQPGLTLRGWDGGSVFVMIPQTKEDQYSPAYFVLSSDILCNLNKSGGLFSTAMQSLLSFLLGWSADQVRIKHSVCRGKKRHLVLMKELDSLAAAALVSGSIWRCGASIFLRRQV